jgi:hypothetical protein
MKNDNHFGQLKIFSKKVYIFEWERVTFHNVPSLYWKNHRILIEKMNC